MSEEKLPTEQDESQVVEVAKKIGHLTSEGIKNATPVVIQSAKKGAHLAAVGGRKGAQLVVAGAGKAKDLVAGFWNKVNETEASLDEELPSGDSPADDSEE